MQGTSEGLGQSGLKETFAAQGIDLAALEPFHLHQTPRESPSCIQAWIYTSATSPRRNSLKEKLFQLLLSEDGTIGIRPGQRKFWDAPLCCLGVIPKLFSQGPNKEPQS